MSFVISKTCLIWQVSHLSPTRDSPKKARAKEPSTPSKSSESVHQRQIIFDAAVYVYQFQLLNLMTRLVSYSSKARKGDKGKASGSSSKVLWKAEPP